MRMGNLLRLAPLGPHEMATKNREVGIAHVTVVPDETGPGERADASDEAVGDPVKSADADAA